jgi:hypothetical protein
MYCECMYVRTYFFIYLPIYADMCACTRIRRMSVTGSRVFRHFELLTHELEYHSPGLIHI